MESQKQNCLGSLETLCFDLNPVWIFFFKCKVPFKIKSIFQTRKKKNQNVLPRCQKIAFPFCFLTNQMSLKYV